MGDAVSKNLDYRHPRWLLISVACGCAILYAGVLLVTNIFPHYNQWHGWPFVYMFRESRVPGDLTVYYGPWPIDDPPLVLFRPVVLVVNGVIGIFLTLSAAISAAYWLRLFQKPLQFSLRMLLGLTTASAGLAVATTFLVYDFWGLLWLSIWVAQFSIYFAPCLPIVTAAHWLLRHPAVSRRKLRWAGLHGVTWLALVAMAGPFMHYSFFAYTGIVYTQREIERGTTHLSGHGWPNKYVATDNDKIPRSTLPWALAEGFGIRYFDSIALCSWPSRQRRLSLKNGFVARRAGCECSGELPWP